MTVVTAVPFSATVSAAVGPPPFEVIAGASLTFDTVTATACVTALVPSLVRTTTSYTLLAPASAGAS